MKHLPLYSETFEEQLKEFKKEIKAKGYSRGREPIYPAMIREFLFFIESNGIRDIKEVKAKHIISHYEYLKQRPNQRREGGLSNSSLHQHLYSLKLFFDYLIAVGVLNSSPAHLPKFGMLKYEERQPITIEEVHVLYKACENLRDKAILGFAYGCGLRRSEIEHLDVNDVLFQKGIVNVRGGKFGKNRAVPMSNIVLKDLKEYALYYRPQLIKNSGMETTSSFMINNWGTRMSGLSLGKRLKALIEKTNNSALINKNISLHHLRHSISTHLMDNGADIEFVQKFLGHTMLDTTHIYSKRRKQRQLLKHAIEESKIIEVRLKNAA